MAQVQKKTSSMSLTISSCHRETCSSSPSVSSFSSTVIQQRNACSSQPVCLSPLGSVNAAVSPSFVKSLDDVRTVSGQPVVLECRVRGTAPLQLIWYRNNKQILDSTDFRIFRKKDVGTLVITEVCPEDSGIIKCTASNEYGAVSSSATLEVYTEDFNETAGHVDEPSSVCSTVVAEEEQASLIRETLFSPKWPDRIEDGSGNHVTGELQSNTKKVTENVEETESSCESAHQTTEVKEVSSSPRLPMSDKTRGVPHRFRPTSKLSKPADSSASMADLPTFSPSLFPPSAFNYERPSHFIQFQPSCQPANTETSLSSPASTTSETLNTPRLSPAPPAMSSSVTFIPKVQNASSSNKTSPAAFLSSVLPSMPSSQAKCISVPQSSSMKSFPASPSLPAKSREQPCSLSSQNHTTSRPWMSKESPRFAPGPQVPNFSHLDSSSLPKPILKKTISRPETHTSDFQGSKDALIQDLEKKLRNSDRQQKHNQKISYEERMARRLLGPDNVASVFHLDNSLTSKSLQHSGSVEENFSGRTRSREINQEGSELTAIHEKFFAPRFVQVPQDVTVEEGQFCRIDFKVVGLPTPDVSWYLDGKPIRCDDYHKMLVCEKSIHSFIIEIVTIHHAGLYECKAQNRAGESRFSMHLDVIAKEELCPPSFLVKMRNSRAMEGEAVKFEWKVAGSPLPQLYWKKDKEMLRIDPLRMNFSQDASGKQCLIIDPVVKSDAGWFTVSAINEAGMSTCNARLDVATQLKTSHPTKPLKISPTVSQMSRLSLDALSSHTAPLYESEEL